MTILDQWMSRPFVVQHINRMAPPTFSNQIGPFERLEEATEAGFQLATEYFAGTITRQSNGDYREDRQRITTVCTPITQAEQDYLLTCPAQELTTLYSRLPKDLYTKWRQSQDWQEQISLYEQYLRINSIGHSIHRVLPFVTVGLTKLDQQVAWRGGRYKLVRQPDFFSGYTLAMKPVPKTRNKRGAAPHLYEQDLKEVELVKSE